MSVQVWCTMYYNVQCKLYFTLFGQPKSRDIRSITIGVGGHHHCVLSAILTCILLSTKMWEYEAWLKVISVWNHTYNLPLTPHLHTQKEVLKAQGPVHNSNPVLVISPSPHKTENQESKPTQYSSQYEEEKDSDEDMWGLGDTVLCLALVLGRTIKQSYWQVSDNL